jgi:hypothetical protein
MLFFRVNGAQASKVKEVLNTFERCTCQLISPMKCSILFAEHRPQDSIDEVRDILQVQQASFESKYLGLPTPEGRMKSERFQPISERLAKRMLNYADRDMSFAGKEIMIKSVAQAIPTYIMSVFQPPGGVCKQLEQVIR